VQNYSWQFVQMCDRICVFVIWVWQWRDVTCYDAMNLGSEIYFRAILLIGVCVCGIAQLIAWKVHYFYSYSDKLNVNCICIVHPKALFVFLGVVWGGVGYKIKWLTRWLKIPVTLLMSRATATVFQWLRLFGPFCTQNFPNRPFVSFLY